MEGEYMALSTIPKGAPLLGYNPTALLRLVKSGKVPAYRIGKHYRIDVDEIKRMGRSGPRENQKGNPQIND